VAFQGQASDLLIKDGDTLAMNGTTYRLDGIDAPELDQVCLNEKVRCGRAAQRLGTGYRSTSARARCVARRGALTPPIASAASASARSRATAARSISGSAGISVQGEARENRRGLWNGCFAAPWDFRHWRKRTGPLLGSCPEEATARDALFPDQAEMPPGCSIKGTAAVRARITGYRGIYHLEGCRSYRTTRYVNRWFCSEEDAKAAGFRKAFTCP
jgi:hypothetical protein